MASLAHTDDAVPMADMNTTPLIDVMLVLLIMFIITIPLQTHAVKIDLPIGGPEVERMKNKLVIDKAGIVLWNGAAVDKPTLRGLLKRSVALDPDPELHIQPVAEAPYAVVNEVLATIRQSGVQAMGFVGNEQYRRF